MVSQAASLAGYLAPSSPWGPAQAPLAGTGLETVWSESRRGLFNRQGRGPDCVEDWASWPLVAFLGALLGCPDHRLLGTLLFLPFGLGLDLILLEDSQAIPLSTTGGPLHACLAQRSSSYCSVPKLCSLYLHLCP